MENEEKRKPKVGDKIILKKGNNNNEEIEGKLLTVIDVEGEDSFEVEDEEDDDEFWVITTKSSRKDIWVFAERKDLIKELKSKIKEKKAEVEKMEAEVDFLSKYESEEDYFAHKIVKIINSGGKEKAIAELLKEMRKTNIL